MANKKFKPCDWCLQEQKKEYGEDNLFEPEENCSMRGYCLKNSNFCKELTKKEFINFMRGI